jgi:hypothetical protein
LSVKMSRVRVEMRYSYAWIPGLLIKIKNPLCVENPLKK